MTAAYAKLRRAKEEGGQKTDDRRRMTDDSRLRKATSCQGGRRSEVRDQRSEGTPVKCTFCLTAIIFKGSI
jgi:hypothetical protein